MAMASDAALTWTAESYPLQFEIGRLRELHDPWDVEFVQKGALLRQSRMQDVERFNGCIIISIEVIQWRSGIVTLTNPSLSNKA